MSYRVLADIVVIAHLAFIVFVIAGGLLVVWQRWIAALHVPAIVWAAWTEFTGTICPLTPLEQSLLERAGETGYRGGFIEHHLVPIIYPPALTPALQVELGVFVVVLNAVVYALLWRAWRRHG